MKATSTAELLSVLCDGKPVAHPRATLRVLVTHSDSGGVVPRLPLWLRWPDPDQKEPLDPITPGVGRKLLGVQSMTNEAGAVTFCGVPSGVTLELVMTRPDDDPSVPEGARFVRLTSYLLNPGEVASRLVAVRPPD